MSLRSVVVSIGLAAAILLLGASAGTPRACAESWSQPVNISQTPGSSWFPDIVVDALGTVRVVWSETDQVRDSHLSGCSTHTWIAVAGQCPTISCPVARRSIGR